MVVQLAKNKGYSVTATARASNTERVSGWSALMACQQPGHLKFFDCPEWGLSPIGANTCTKPEGTNVTASARASSADRVRGRYM